MSEPEESIRVVEIHPDARYVVTIAGLVPTSRIEHTQTALRQWWESGEKFFILCSSGVTVRLERVDNDRP